MARVVLIHWNTEEAGTGLERLRRPAVGRALAQALPSPVPNPLVPGTLAGYSGTPLVKKLGIKPGSAVALIGAPPRFDRKLEPLPEGASLFEAARPAGWAVVRDVSENAMRRVGLDAGWVDYTVRPAQLVPRPVRRYA